MTWLALATSIRSIGVLDLLGDLQWRGGFDFRFHECWLAGLPSHRHFVLRGLRLVEPDFAWDLLGPRFRAPHSIVTRRSAMFELFDGVQRLRVYDDAVCLLS